MPTTPSRGGGYSADTLYFTTEFSGDNELNTGRIYLGGTLMAKPSVWEELPEPSPYQMVDLGLPSGLKWADMNVGAAKPEDIGDYFMFGSTTPDTDKPCDWAHAPFNNGSSSFDSNYFDEHVSEWFDFVYTPGPTLFYLKPEYDAAIQIMGGAWRMPTETEMGELIDGTTHTVETLNGVNGMRFTSNANGNSIFLPFGGYRIAEQTYGYGETGYIWLTRHNTGDSAFNTAFGTKPVVSSNPFFLGSNIRGVC